MSTFFSNSICHYAQAKVVQASFVKSDNMMVDVLTKALPTTKISGLLRGAKATGLAVVPHGGNLQPRRETRTCYNCNKAGHIAADCRGKKNNGGGNGNGRGVHITIAVVNDTEIIQDRWFFDSGLVDTFCVMRECLKVPAIVVASACFQMNNRYV